MAKFWLVYFLPYNTVQFRCALKQFLCFVLHRVVISVVFCRGRWLLKFWRIVIDMLRPVWMGLSGSGGTRRNCSSSRRAIRMACAQVTSISRSLKSQRVSTCRWSGGKGPGQTSKSWCLLRQDKMDRLIIGYSPRVQKGLSKTSLRRAQGGKNSAAGVPFSLHCHKES